MKQPGKAMIHSSRRDRKTKAIAEVLAMIGDAHPELDPHQPRPVRETDEWLWESATEFCAALDRHAERTMEIKRESTASIHASRAARAVLHQSHTGYLFILQAGLCRSFDGMPRPTSLARQGSLWCRWTRKQQDNGFGLSPIRGLPVKPVASLA